jgi:4-oxalomesaconate tautomerase
VLLAAMGSPDPRQIDGLGGADSLTSKVAIVSPSRPDADVDYLFLQVSVAEALVSDRQNCGNLLAGVGPFALERGMVQAGTARPTFASSCATPTAWPRRGSRRRAVGCAMTATAVSTACRAPAAPIPITFADVAGSTCGALLPTGNVVDEIEGVAVTCIDNGMPVVIVRAADLGVRGDEAVAVLEAGAALRAKVEAIRLEAGRRMNLGDVTSATTIPKVTLVSPPTGGGALSTRSFIPHTVHKAIGVFGAVSVATAACLPGSVAASVATLPAIAGEVAVSVEHPTGEFTALLTLSAAGEVISAALLRTARLLMAGQVIVPASVWDGRA